MKRHSAAGYRFADSGGGLSAMRARRLATRLCGLSTAAYVFWLVNFGGGLVQSLRGGHPTAAGTTSLFLIICLAGLAVFASATWSLAAERPIAASFARVAAVFDLCVQGVLLLPRSGSPLLLLLSLLWIVVDVAIVLSVRPKRDEGAPR
jgi:hypothetical protein